MLEDDKLTRGHETTSGTAIVLEHVHERLPQKIEVGLAEAGLLSQGGGDEPFDAIETIGHVLLASHGLVVLILLGFSRSHARNAHLERYDWINRFAEAQLHRSAHLAAIDTCCHDRTKSPNVIKVIAHELSDFYLILHFLWEFFCLWGELVMYVRLAIALIENGAFLHVDLVAQLPLIHIGIIYGFAFNKVNVIANLTLDAHVGNDSLRGVGIDTWEISCIGVTVGIAVLNIAEENEVIAVLNWL